MAEPGLVRNYPWRPQSFLLGNLAIGNLREQLRLGLSTELGLNAPTLMVAIGVLAGFAAQNAALIHSAGKTAAGQAVPGDELALLTTASGDRHLSGKLIERLLFDEQGSQPPVALLVTEAAVTHGAVLPEMPDREEIVGHVAGTIGTGAFGIVRAPAGDTPRRQAIECLTQHWPVFEQLMRLPPPAQVRAPDELPLDEACWPILASLAADQFIERARDVLAPDTSAALVIEAAVVGSMIDPELIVPGRWALEPNPDYLKVTRASL